MSKNLKVEELVTHRVVPGGRAAELQGDARVHLRAAGQPALGGGLLAEEGPGIVRLAPAGDHVRDGVHLRQVDLLGGRVRALPQVPHVQVEAHPPRRVLAHARLLDGHVVVLAILGEHHQRQLPPRDGPLAHEVLAVVVQLQLPLPLRHGAHPHQRLRLLLLGPRLHAVGVVDLRQAVGQRRRDGVVGARGRPRGPRLRHLRLQCSRE
mmetsp:Transcript_1939/g.4382  ORF Transcript_1939/g.4382 Transcript_1939/m.4382 type:complete len:208 (+) Transcript_1939:275-898(+)